MRKRAGPQVKPHRYTMWTYGAAAYGEKTRRRIKSFCDGSFYIPMQKNNTVSIRMWSFMRIYQGIQL